MRAVPEFMNELDSFEDALYRYVTGATPRELSVLIQEATIFIEKQAENADAETFCYDGWTWLNNATAAINTAARILARNSTATLLATTSQVG